MGRTAVDNDLILNDASVSEKHAKIVRREKQFFLQDLDSTNGTTLKGVRLGKDEKVMLNQGDQFRVGTMWIMFSRIPDKKSSAEAPSMEEAGEPDNSGKRRKKLLIMGGAIFLTLLLLLKVSLKPGQRAQSPKIASPTVSGKTIPLPAKSNYGLTRKGDKSRPDKAVFSFVAESGIVDLHYSTGGIDSKGEVVILLNGTKIADVPLAVDRWQDGLVLPLKRKLIIKGGENRLVFDNVKNPPGSEQWGVKDLRVEFSPPQPCDENESKRLFDIGENLYNERQISSENLFKATQYYRKAISMADECQPEPDLLADAEKRFTAVRGELDSLYDEYILAFKKSANLKEYQEAADSLRAIKNLFPDERDYRNKESKRLFEKLTKFLSGGR